MATPHLTLVTGGAWSGKTAFARHLWAPYPEVLHIGTALRSDPLLDAHISALVALRPKSWTHIHEPMNVVDALQFSETQGHPVMIDSASQMISNIGVKSLSKYTPEQMFDHLNNATELLTDAIEKHAQKTPVLVVTAETGWSPAPEQPILWAIRRATGLMNQRLAAMSQSVYVVCCGIEKKIK